MYPFLVQSTSANITQANHTLPQRDRERYNKLHNIKLAIPKRTTILFAAVDTIDTADEYRLR